MSKQTGLVLTAVAAATLALSACQSLSGVFDNSDDGASKQQAQTQKVEAGKADAAKRKGKGEATQNKYEKAPDLSNAEVLSYTPGSLSNDTAGRIPESGVIDMSTDPDRVSQGVSLSDNLESAPATHNTALGVANPYASVTEGGTADNVETLLFDSNAVQQQPQQPQVRSVQDFDAYPTGNNGSCSLALHNEASGIADTLMRELVLRLRTEPGYIFVAPSIISSEYNECINDLSPALRNALAGNETFVLTGGNTNINNVISQNAGSAAMLPRIISQSRAAGISYVVTSIISKKGDRAALSLRIIRTSDGVTMTQGFRRLSK